MSNGAGPKADAPLEVLNIIQHVGVKYTLPIYDYIYIYIRPDFL
jgi:hypothetical protein